MVCRATLLRKQSFIVCPVDIFQELNKQVPNITMQLIDRAFKQMLYDALYTVS